MRLFLSTALSVCLALPALAEMAPRDGWWVKTTTKPYQQLIDDVKAAVKANKFGVVTEAGPTAVAAKRGVTIPGNRVIGVYNNKYAVRVLNLSTAAMIEAPIRMYVTENDDGTATLSYKLPTTIYAPYMAEAGPDLDVAAKELDAVFATIAETAAN